MEQEIKIKKEKIGLDIEDLKVSVDGKEIIKGINLQVKPGEIHAIMGPNGSGKTSLSFAIMGHPKYKVSSGKIIFNGEDINELKTYQRAKKGIFLAFQYPQEIPGVPLGKFLWSLSEAQKKFAEFSQDLKNKMADLKLPDEFTKRELNKGMSGGEKKRTEILQMLILKPKLVILDEIDSGLDIDSLKIVAQELLNYFDSEKMIIIITHYPRILNYVKPTKVHILYDGKIVLSGGFELATELEEKGYEKLLREKGISISPTKIGISPKGVK